MAWNPHPDPLAVLHRWAQRGERSGPASHCDLEAEGVRGQGPQARPRPLLFVTGPQAAPWRVGCSWLGGSRGTLPRHTRGRGLGYSTEESRLILSKERDGGGGSGELAAPGSREPLWAPGPRGASPGPPSALFAFPGGFSPRSVCCPSLLSSLGMRETSALINPEWPGAAGQRCAIAFISTCPQGSRLGPDGGELPLPERSLPSRKRQKLIWPSRLFT